MKAQLNKSCSAKRVWKRAAWRVAPLLQRPCLIDFVSEDVYFLVYWEVMDNECFLGNHKTFLLFHKSSVKQKSLCDLRNWAHHLPSVLFIHLLLFHLHYASKTCSVWIKYWWGSCWLTLVSLRLPNSYWRSSICFSEPLKDIKKIPQSQQLTSAGNYRRNRCNDSSGRTVLLANTVLTLPYYHKRKLLAGLNQKLYIHKDEVVCVLNLARLWPNLVQLKVEF